MKNGRFVFALIFVMFMTILAILPLQMIRSSTTQKEDIRGTKVSQTSPEPRKDNSTSIPNTDPIKQLLDSMTLEEKVGQMFIGGSYKEDMLADQLKLISNQHFGGIILFQVNVSSPEITKLTINRVKQIDDNSNIPLFLSIDEEGGSVSRLWSQLSEQTAQNNIKDTNSAYQVANRRGLELNKLGINLNFSPVMDRSTKEDSFMYKRVFHTSDEEIAKLSASMIEGYKAAGVVAVPKHFPGHPDNEVDSHDALPTSSINRDQFNTYAKQFEILIKSNSPEMLMIGHISFPKIDPKYPTTLSRIFLTDILRKEYGYEGVIISDDINMGAVKNSFQFEESVLLSVEAGNDILILVTQPKFQLSAYNTLLQAVKTGRISEERIDESVYRILELKADL